MNLFARDPKPTNVSRLEAELYKHGFRDDGYATALDPTAAAVEMSGYVHIDQLEAVCRALQETNQSVNREIHITARMTISTAVAVCEALRKWRKK